MSGLNERLRACSVSTDLGWDRHLWDLDIGVLRVLSTGSLVSLCLSLLLITRVHAHDDVTTQARRLSCKENSQSSQPVPILPPLSPQA